MFLLDVVEVVFAKRGTMRNVSCTSCGSPTKEIVYICHDNCPGAVAVDIGLCFQPPYVELLQCLHQVVLLGLWRRPDAINGLPREPGVL